MSSFPEIIVRDKVYDPNVLDYVPMTQPGTVSVGGGMTNAEFTAHLPLPVLATIDPTGLATAIGQTAGNASLASIDGKLTNPLPVSLPAATVITLTPPAAITGFATAANQTIELASLSSIDAKLTNPLPVSLPAGTVTTLTPPAAITGFALETTQILQATAAGQSATQPRSITNFPTTQPVSMIAGAQVDLANLLAFTQSQLLDVLQDIRTELRVLNTVALSGLNVREDLDELRADPSYTS